MFLITVKLSRARHLHPKLNGETHSDKLLLQVHTGGEGLNVYVEHIRWTYMLNIYVEMYVEPIQSNL